MARPAKTIEFYNDYDDVLVMTMNEFLEEMNLTGAYGQSMKKNLYKAKGAGIDGERWRVGQAPEHVKTIATTSEMIMYHYAEQDLLQGKASEDTKDMILGYESALYIQPEHRMTNAYLVLSGHAEDLEVNPLLKFSATMMNGNKRSGTFTRTAECPTGTF